MNRNAIKRWAIAGGILGAVCAIALAFLAYHFRQDWVPYYTEWRDQIVAWLRHIPAPLFFLLLATVPVLPVPMSVFYLSTGIYPVPVALVGILIAIPVNLTLSYWLVRTLFKPIAVRLLAKMGREIPRAKSKQGEVMFSILVRVCGMPYALQNYLLALSHIPFRTYILVGIPLQVLPAIAMMLLGGSIMNGQGRTALLAVALLTAIVIATKLLRDSLQRKRDARNEAL